MCSRVYLLLLFGYVLERSKGGWENEFDGGSGYLFTIFNYLSACYMAIE